MGGGGGGRLRGGGGGVEVGERLTDLFKMTGRSMEFTLRWERAGIDKWNNIEKVPRQVGPRIPDHG